MLVSHILSHSHLECRTACPVHASYALTKPEVSKHPFSEKGGTHGDQTERKEMRKLLTISAVQEELSVSRSSVYRLIGRGKFDVVHVLNAPRITQESVELYITENLAAGSAVAR
jgi:hypothetical protein